MMISKVKFIYLLLIILLIDLVQTRFTEVPPPPKRPERFHSRDELKRYLQKVHEYHLILGRWRMRREYDLFDPSNEDLFEFFDINKDHYISMDEFSQRLKSPKGLHET